jgi:hypothetical protein
MDRSPSSRKESSHLIVVVAVVEFPRCSCVSGALGNVCNAKTLVPSRGLAARDLMARAPLKLNLERSIRSRN